MTFAVTLLFIQPAWSQEKITYRLKWLINMSAAGDVVAGSQGFFKEQGLDVTIKEGGPERDAIRELELGYAHFGVASADQVIQALAKGAPVVVIAQLFQVNPLQWIYFKDKVQLHTVADLKGKTIGVTFGKNDEFIMRTILSKGAIAQDQVKLFSVRLDYTPFYKRQVDLWPVYANTQAVEISRKLQAAGEAYGFLNPTDYGVRFVANSVVTSSRMLAEKPDVVRRFSEALLKGWQTAIEPSHSESVLAAMRQYDRDTAKEILVAQLQETRRLVQPQAGQRVGGIDIEAWKQTEQIMVDHRQISRPVDVVKYLVRPSWE
jgi:NitT/TauT family transport system substrate-binding protein